MSKCIYHYGSGECSFSEDGECTYSGYGCYYDNEEKDKEEE